jgi:S-DNA-T family DNA segregation ATPase FtsK/SpoIIIE
LGAASATLTLAIFAALIGHTGFPAVLGRFLAETYGAAAFLVPAYLLAGSLVLADPGYRADRLFVYFCAALPVLTVELGAGALVDADAFFSRHPYLSFLSPTGFIAVVVTAAVLECLVIALLVSALFKARRPSDPQRFRERKRPTAPLRLRFLAPPPAAPRAEAPRPDSPRAEPSPDRPLLPALPEPRILGSRAAFDALQARPDEPAPRSPAPLEPGIYLAPDGERVAEIVPEELPAAEAVGEETASGAEEDADEVVDVSGLLKRAASPEGPDAAAVSAGPVAEEPAAAPEPAPEVPAPLEYVDPAVFFGDAPVSGAAAAAAVGAGDLARALSAAEAAAAAKSKAAAEQAALLAKESAESSGPPPPRKRRDAPYGIPVDGILTAYPDGQYWVIDQATRDSALILKNTLEEFKIQAEVTGIRKGPVITMFEILPAPGVKLSKIVNLQDNIALRLAASSVRIVAPIPGKHAVGIEVPNRKRNIVSFKEMIEGELHREGKKPEIPMILGKDITGEAISIDLVSTPHLLIAGATGSGKSVCVNSMILSILYQKSPAEVRMILIDPKIVELKLYNDIPHLLTPVITEPKRAFQALQYCIYEMERRYALLDSMGVRDIRSYNRRIKERNIATERLPYIVVVIDEFADLMATTGKELESTVARLAAMSRAVGIHLVLATQRPSIDVITGLIKANIPSRIAFMVAGKMDSRIIIDMVGAEKLLGKGDMLYAGVTDPFPIRMQGAFVSEEEVERVVEYVKTLGEPDYIDEEIFYDEDEEEAEPSLFGDEDDPLFDKALEIVMQQGKASASYIQRRLKIGYNRAARLVELMEDRGIVGPAQGSKPRDLLRGQ